MSYDDVTYWFSPEKDYGTLDWGRGVWTYDNTWYWGSGNGTIGRESLSDLISDTDSEIRQPRRRISCSTLETGINWMT